MSEYHENSPQLKWTKEHIKQLEFLYPLMPETIDVLIESDMREKDFRAKINKLYLQYKGL